jgi:hypothetical protein
MSSIVSEILASAKRGSVNQIKDLNDCSDRLANKCEELKQTLYWDLNKEFVDYESLHEPSLDLLAQVAMGVWQGVTMDSLKYR